MNLIDLDVEETCAIDAEERSRVLCLAKFKNSERDSTIASIPTTVHPPEEAREKGKHVE